MTFEKVDSQKTFDFIKSTIYFLRKKISMDRKFFLVLDNSPKNRSNNLKELANKKWISLIYTVPTIPQDNYIEQLFSSDI